MTPPVTRHPNNPPPWGVTEGWRVIGTRLYQYNRIGPFLQVCPTDFDAHSASKPAAVALIELFAHHPPSSITLVCLGPLTNIALALKLDPEFGKRPKKVVMLGGNIHGSFHKKTLTHTKTLFNGRVKQRETCTATPLPKGTSPTTPKQRTLCWPKWSVP